MRRIQLETAHFDVEETYCQFWDNLSSGNWEATTLKVFTDCIDDRTTFVDIGAWIGPTTLFAANLAKRVVSIEADPVAAAQLVRNVALNPRLSEKVEVLERAMSGNEGVAKFGARTGRGDSMSSVLFAKGEDSWDAATITPAQLAARLTSEEKLFFKIDIEGGEYDLLRHFGPLAALPNATFLIAFHPRFLPGGSLWSPQTALKTAQALRTFHSYRFSLVKKRSIRNLPVFSMLNRLGLAFFPVHHSILASKA
jgi:FkbM family methyltransferase